MGNVSLREMRRLKANPAYILCMVVFPILVTVFFTSLMGEGVPQDMPVGVVDCDNTSTTRKITRTLDAMQSSKVVERYSSFEQARQAMQDGDIYGFIYFPKGTTDNLLSQRRPTVSYYYSYASLTSGALVFRDLKTTTTLGSAAVGSATLSARGYTSQQISTFLQPIRVDLHPIGNPWVSYNIYLSTMLVPGCLLLFVFLITAYSIGSELKSKTSHEWMSAAGGNIFIAITGKVLPQFIIFLMIMYGYMAYIFFVLGFPHAGGLSVILLLGLLSIIASEGFSIFLFGIFPSMRMSMSINSLWGVLSFSMVGTAFPAFAMDPALQVLANLFPLRHYFMIYDQCILNASPLSDVWPHIVALATFAALPLLVTVSIHKAMDKYVYIP